MALIWECRRTASVEGRRLNDRIRWSASEHIAIEPIWELLRGGHIDRAKTWDALHEAGCRALGVDGERRQRWDVLRLRFQAFAKRAERRVLLHLHLILGKQVALKEAKQPPVGKVDVPLFVHVAALRIVVRPGQYERRWPGQDATSRQSCWTEACKAHLGRQW
eukprot:747219-Prymnesium_polylepis.1